MGNGKSNYNRKLEEEKKEKNNPYDIFKKKNIDLLDLIKKPAEKVEAPKAVEEKVEEQNTVEPESTESAAE